MDQMHEYHGEISITVAEGNRGTILRFLRDDNEVITEIQLSRAGAEWLALELIRRARCTTSTTIPTTS